MLTANLRKGKECAFDAFCKKVLRNEARDQYDKTKRQQKKEILFCELTSQELGSLSVVDTYFLNENLVPFGDAFVGIEDDALAEALLLLPARRREIIFLSYYLGLSDREIGERMDLLRATVQYQRKRALQQLKTLISEKR